MSLRFHTPRSDRRQPSPAAVGRSPCLGATAADVLPALPQRLSRAARPLPYPAKGFRVLSSVWIQIFVIIRCTAWTGLRRSRGQSPAEEEAAAAPVPGAIALSRHWDVAELLVGQRWVRGGILSWAQDS